MASANQRKANFISYKLNFLKDQRDHLTIAVGQYVYRIIAAGESWKQGRDNTVGYQELSQMIDTAAEFLCEKCDELTDLTSQSITAAASTHTTSDRQPAAPLASTGTTSYRQSTESVQPADETRLKPMLSKMAVLGGSLYSYWSRPGKVAEHQSGSDQQLKEVLIKLSELDNKHSSMFEQVKQQMSDISERRDAVEHEQKTHLQSLEKRLQQIHMTQNRQKLETERLVHVPNLLESVKKNVNALDARIEGIIDVCRNKHEDIETVRRDLADKVMANSRSFKVLFEGQDKIALMLKILETRLQTLEVDGRRNVKNVQKQAEKGETNFRILCQMLNDRVRPLEQLRTCLNERASMRDDNVTKLSQLIQEVAVMSPRLQQLEVKSPGTRCGFSARTLLTEVASHTTISQYETTFCNVGENFNQDSGVFTAPVDGLYVAAISCWLAGNVLLSVGVQYKRSLDQESSTSVCQSSAVKKSTTGCGVGVVDMKAGEVLISYVHQTVKIDYGKLVYFSCFLLG